MKDPIVIVHKTKICSKCGEEKDESEFVKRAVQCNKCKLISDKQYYINNKEKLLKYGKEYYINNKNKDKSYMVDIVCLNCGKNRKALKSSIRNNGRNFCSNSCSAKYHKGELSPTWQGGISFGKYCSKFNEEFKNRVRAFFDYQCFMCGKNESENIKKEKNNIRAINLSVHHVCYNKKACCDDTPRYFVPLCLKHHGITNGKKNRARWEEMFKRCLLEMYDGRSFYTKDEYNKIFNEKEL